MKKFLAVFDGYKMSQSTLDYAIQLTKSAEAHLTGIFLDEFIYHSYNVQEIVSSKRDYEKVLEKLNKLDEEKREQAALHFKSVCEEEGIPFNVHSNKNIAIQELKSESMFADMIIIDQNETFAKYSEAPPTRFVKELLGSTQCPVLVVPDGFEPINKITLLYDGGPASLHAIKMFSYILGNPANLPVEVFTVREAKKKDLHLPGHKSMREFIKRHFPKAKFITGKGVPEEEIVKFLKTHHKNEIVVLGAYQRSDLSRWFKISMADVLMKSLKLPLFIAHNK